MPVAFRNGAVCNITQYKNPPPKKEKRKEVRNMKHVKKLFAMLMAVMMLVGLLSVTSFAANADLSKHTYEAYQIFKGTQAADSAVLGNLDWGTGINSGDFLAALKASTAFGATNPFATCANAQDVAKVVAGWSDNSAEAMAFAKVAYKYIKGDGAEIGDTLPAGYYLVVDTTDVAGKDDVKNLALLQLTNKGTFDILSKVDQPKVEKKVDDKNDSNNTEDATTWQDSADYDINDHVPFLLKATLGTIADYDTYKVVFHDTMSKGLTYDANSAVVKIYKDGDVTNTAEANVVTVTANFTFATAAATDTEGAYVGGNTLTWSCADVKALGATDKSVITVEYTATLNEDANIGSAGNPNEVYLEYSNNPNESGSGDKDNTGKTPEDKVIVFTYKVVANKYANEVSDTTKLKGAGFTLYKFIPAENGADTLDNVKGNWTAIGTEVKGADMTTFEWKGIDDGEYKLVETTTPAGYNTIDPILFTVSAAHDTDNPDPKLTSLTGDTFSGEVTTGALTGNVINLSGSTLPETGGMGTYIFYAVGGVLVLAAVVLFVTKKRMSNAD